MSGYHFRMKKKLLILLLLLPSLLSWGDVTVRSFRKMEQDSTARVIAPKMGKNGELCALIKVQTPYSGFAWKSDEWSILPSYHKNGVFYLYVPSTATRITIWHSKLGFIRNYLYPLRIEKASVYELVLGSEKSNPTLKTTEEKPLEKQLISITTDPSDADVTINEQFVGKSPYTKELPLGKYHWRVGKNYFFDESGNFELLSGHPLKMNQKLKRGFGTLYVTSIPNKGALITLDGISTGKKTPCKLDSVPMGTHIIGLSLDRYDTSQKSITLAAAENKPVSFYMHPNFAEVSLISDPLGDIYINGALKANGSWKGRLDPGDYLFEAKHDTVTVSEQRQLEMGESFSLTLRPTASTGGLRISSSPSTATVKIDGKQVCQTPILLKKVLAGSYSLELSILGYKVYSERITITEGQTTNINANLFNGRFVSIASSPAGATLMIDGVKVGKTPYSAIVSFGNHILEIEQGGEQAEKMVIIAEKGGETNFNMNFEMTFKRFSEKVNGLVYDMQPIRGGSFEMGSEKDESAEKPLHTVAINSFYMGKTEVTQALWQSVMGENPSIFKGAELPVENVSWENVQQFISKLNELTGKRYRLPTEAEWEYAAGSVRGSKLTLSATTAAHNVWSGTNKESSLNFYAWHNDNASKSTHLVATKQSNAFGLYDMTGNVWEWCSDWYGPYESEEQTNPTGASTGSYRVCRGGSWFSAPRISRVGYRNLISPNYRTDEIGCRLVLDAK